MKIISSFCVKFKFFLEDFNIQNSNKIKYSNIVSIRGKSKNVGKSYKNINLTSKNNTKSKHKKKISNLI